MKRLRLLLLVLGFALFLHLVQRIGFATVWTQLRRIGWWLLPIGVLGVLWHWLQAWAWQRILRQRRRIALRSLYLIKVVGETINTITPAGFLGGDPMRIYLLRRHLPWIFGTASVVIDRTVQAMATLVTIVMGVLLIYWRIPHLPMNMRYGLPIVLIIACAFITYIFLHQQHGFFGFGLQLLKRFRIRRHIAPQRVEQVEELDRRIAEFYRHDPSGFWLALLLHWAGRMLGIVEIYWIGHAVNPLFGWPEAFILGALAPLINLVFSFIPGAFGVMEGAFSGALYLMHLPPALGVTIQIVKRLRSGLWILLGFVCLSLQDKRGT
ncbi:MAG: flippase-like domain-containing protein [Deltaproteobacteria bacterium]|nr:flippase-like domain-containing protein [Deltaproteobacteria bacterium]